METDPPARGQWPRILQLVLVTSGFVLTVIGMRGLNWLLGPLLLALMIVILVHPVHRALLGVGVPPIGALIGLLVVVYGILIGLVAIVVYSLARLATILPGYASAVVAEVNRLRRELSDLGIGSDQMRQLLLNLDVGQITRWVTSQIPPLIGVVGNIILLCSLLLFLAVESTQITRRANPLMSGHPRTGAAITEAVGNIRRFITVTGIFALVVGALNTIFLMIINVPLAPLWGLLAAACNFIPYIGFIIGVVPPALLALLGHDWKLMLVVIAVYVVLNAVITGLVPTKVVGDAVGLSMAATMLSVVFWAWVLGPIGTVMAVPLTLMAKAVLVDADPRAAWVRGFLNSDALNRRDPGITEE